MATSFGEDYWDLLQDAVDVVAGWAGSKSISQAEADVEPRPTPPDWTRWVAASPGARALQSSPEGHGLPQEPMPSGGAEGVGFTHSSGEPTKRGGRVAAREERRRSNRKRWDYDASVESIIRTLCEDMEEYAGVYKVEAADLVKDVFQLLSLDAPVLTRPDKDYAEGVAAVRDWLLSDVEAVARSFDLRPWDVLEDVFYDIINDEVRPRDKAAEMGSLIAIQTQTHRVPSM